MGRELLILRHAQAKPAEHAGADADRSLTRAGVRDARAVGVWLREQRLRPDHLLSSPARRTRQTVSEVCAGLDLGGAEIRWDGRIYEAGLNDLLNALADSPAAAERLLLVGHNPGLEQLLVHLGADLPVPADGRWMPTATLARLELEAEDWGGLEQGVGRLLQLRRPD